MFAQSAQFIHACCADTHDNQTGVREGNLYFELNRMLRERGVEERLAMLKVRAQSEWTARNRRNTLKSNTARGNNLVWRLRLHTEFN